MSRIDRITLLISLAAVIAASIVSLRIYEGLPHIEDETAFVWQAKVIARGQLVLPTPEPCPNCFLVPFVVDYQGFRFGKYPLGWPVVLALGELLHVRWLVNPLLAGLGIWLIYLLIKKLTNEAAGLVGAILTATSPFFMLNSGSLLSHSWSLVLSLAFYLAWLDAFGVVNPRLPARWSRRLPTIAAALAMGGLALTRPLTAVAVALPIAVHGLLLLVRGDRPVRLRLLGFGILAGSLSLLHFAWQYSVTGNALLNPYTLWWPYDTIGFGPGVGLQEGGYWPAYALINAQFSLAYGASDLFGWPGISWLLMPFGLLALLLDTRLRRSAGIWLTVSILPSLVLAYSLYWIGSWLYGPRYYFEGITSAVLLSVMGLRWLVGSFPRLLSGESAIVRWRRNALNIVRFLVVTGFVTAMVIFNLAYYIPARLGGMVGLYGVSRSCLTPFQTSLAKTSAPALILVHVQDKWIEYGCMLDLSSPFMDSDFVFTVSRGSEMDAAVAATMPRRTVLHYYPDTHRLSASPRIIPPQ